MLRQHKLMWTFTRHGLSQPFLACHASAGRQTLKNTLKCLVQWDHCQVRLNTSEPKPLRKTAQEIAHTKKGVKTKRAMSAGRPLQTQSLNGEDISVDVMYSNKGSIRRLKTQHLPSRTTTTSKQTTGSKEHGSKSDASSSKSKSRQNQKNDSSREGTKIPFPSHFREYSSTEKIETLDTKSVRDLFMKQQGTFFHASGSVFTIKATRRQFAQPEPVRIPPFVRKAIEEYEHQYDVYNKALQKREQRGGEGARSELTPCPETEATAATCTTPPSRTNSSSTASPEPLPPTLPFTAQQFIHKPLRFFPPTPESIHTPFRVSVLSPKKTISKLAVYRTLCRRKFYQAIEKVFRGRAQPGFDYMIFAGKDSILTPQSRLEQLLIKALEDPRLHGGRFKSQKSSSTKNGAQGRPQVVMPETLHSSPIAQNKNAIAAHSPRAEGTEGEEAKEQCLQEQINSSPRLRYKDDKKPPLKNFWKHALPNPLPRKLFPEHYLDQYVNKGDPNSPEHKRAVVLRQRQGMWLHLRKVINKEKQLKAVKAAEERNKLLAQHRAFVDSLIEKHFAQRS